MKKIILLLFVFAIFSCSKMGNPEKSKTEETWVLQKNHKFLNVDFGGTTMYIMTKDTLTGYVYVTSMSNVVIIKNSQ